MRVAILISFTLGSMVLVAAPVESFFEQVTLGPNHGYIIPASYAEDHRDDLVASLPGVVKIDGFWTPTDANVEVAERVFRDLIQSAAKDPSLLFPDLAKATDSDSIGSLRKEKDELVLVNANYDAYLRQYIGVIIGGTKVVLCNYSDAPKIDPAREYIFLQKAFALDGTVHFLQCRFDPATKTCSHVSIIGSWQKSNLSH